MEHLNEYLDFIRTVEGIKSVTRTAWTKTGRQESTAEHSFRLALLALTLIDEFPELDAKKVLSMCLIHDLGELYAGDIPAISIRIPLQNPNRNTLIFVGSSSFSPSQNGQNFFPVERIQQLLHPGSTSGKGTG